MKIVMLFFFLLTLFGAANMALAYVGPGAGLSLLGALWGLLLAIGAALAFVILWPLRRMRQRARVKNEKTTGGEHVSRQ
jgi:hypothetical protein